jgi:A118 family predicted phage portal protein
MLGQTSVKTALNVDIAVSADMANALQTWSLMYVNQATWLNNDIVSLNLPAAIAGEISKSTTIEMKVDVAGSARAEFLATQLGKLLPKIRQMVEYGCAKGGLMFKPFVNGDEIDIDCIQADQFFPISFDANGNIIACVFADQRTVGNSYYTRLEYHTMTPQGCLIKNIAYKSSTSSDLGQQISLTEFDAWKDLVPEATITDIKKPLYAYFRFPMANNIDPSSPLGVSCYARAVDLIKQVDIQWSNLVWEFESGKRAIYADTDAFDKTSDGKPILPNKRLYRTLSKAGNIVDDSDLFTEWSPEFREASILSGLDAMLKKVEYACGIAYGTISDPQEQVKTATELKTSRQRTYATISDTQKALQAAIEQLLYAMDVWASLSRLSPKGPYQATFTFDDSIITDMDSQFSHDSQALGLQVMSKVEFRMRNYGEDETTAKKKIAEIQNEQQPTDFFGQNK